MEAHRFRRQLLIRLLGGGLFIVVVLGSIVLWLDLERVDRMIADLGTEEARLLSPHLPASLAGMDNAARHRLDAEMDAMMASRARMPGGHFAIAEIYGLNGQSLAESATPEAAEVEDRIDLARHTFPDPGKTWYKKHFIGGKAYIQVLTPLWNGNTQIGWFEGVFQIPMQVLLAVALSGLRATLMVVVAIVATTALLYPLLASLNARLLARTRALLHANVGTLEALGSAIAKRDSDTNAHNYRVVLYSVRLAEAAGLAPRQIRSLIKGAFLHDVGKIAIPDRILLKPGKLDSDEMAIMQTHVQHGLDIVNRFDWLKDAAEVVGGHHEWVDGSGYPAGLAGDAIPLNARVFAIADVFDALTSRRPYKDPFPLEKALTIMRDGRASHFDAGLLDIFLTIAPRLHAHICGRDDEGLSQELREVGTTYFANTIAG